ncbi:hypothetical protein GN958_ATG20980 [Phytophthora infestans]|nr:hypothetical protein GN958_ATG20980 [Phytophthora infestans]
MPLPATGQILRGAYTNDELLEMLSSDEESELQEMVPATVIRANFMLDSAGKTEYTATNN